LRSVSECGGIDTDVTPRPRDMIVAMDSCWTTKHGQDLTRWDLGDILDLTEGCISQLVTQAIGCRREGCGLGDVQR
jgi:hypothetical protein